MTTLPDLRPQGQTQDDQSRDLDSRIGAIRDAVRDLQAGADGPHAAALTHDIRGDLTALMLAWHLSGAGKPYRAIQRAAELLVTTIGAELARADETPDPDIRSWCLVDIRKAVGGLDVLAARRERLAQIAQIGRQS